jgi:hypothetical protein
MNFVNDTDPSRQAARSWSGRLGSLAAAAPAIRPEAASTHLDSAPLPARWALVLEQLLRARRREHAADKLRSHEFILAP